MSRVSLVFQNPSLLSYHFTEEIPSKQSLETEIQRLEVSIISSITNYDLYLASAEMEVQNKLSDCTNQVAQINLKIGKLLADLDQKVEITLDEYQ